MTHPASGLGQSGVLVLPPVGYQYWSTHRTLRVLAERLAERGQTVLRLDYDGTGDSSGDQWAQERLEAWRRSAQAGADELRRLGCQELVVVGARLGATIGLLDGAELGADRVVAWAPVLSGRQHVREVRLLSEDLPVAMDRAPGDQVITGVVMAGVIFRTETLADLAAIKLDTLTSVPAARILMIEGVEPGAAVVAGRMTELGAAVDLLAIAEGREVLDQPAEYATPPRPLIDVICTWVGPSSGAAPVDRLDHKSASISWRGSQLREEVVELGPRRLVGVATEPIGGSSGPIAVFLNSGSEPHVGPGRAWVEYARDLGALGFASLRVDFRGWGESPDDGFAPGRPYDAHGEEDTISIIHAITQRYERPVVLVGLCAGAWIGLRVALRERVAGVIALNPQLYWRQGDPVEATMVETRLRRTASRRREELGKRFGVWSMLDLVGHRPWAATWLDQLSAGDAEILILFAEGDEGIGYLEQRLTRRWRMARASGRIRVNQLPDIDHSMHRAWLRGAVLRELHEQLRRLDTTDRQTRR
ncbi:MAG: alpha/beta fold hydrolase [Candidatus Limnocylindria bacterium]